MYGLLEFYQRQALIRTDHSTCLYRVLLPNSDLVGWLFLKVTSRLLEVFRDRDKKTSRSD